MSQARPTSIFFPFLLGLLAGAWVPVLAAYLYVSSGRAPVSAGEPTLALEELVINRALQRQVAASRPLQSPISATDTNFEAGARVYLRQCAICHGTPSRRLSKIASGMYPPPPQLFHGEGVTSRPVGETYWKISHGVRLTGMPGFRTFLSDTEMWQLSLLLANAHSLPPSVAAALDATSPSPTSARTR